MPVRLKLACNMKQGREAGKEAVLFSAKTYSLASASFAAAMLVLGTSPGYSATNDRIVLAQQAEPADAAQAEQTLSANEETAQAPEADAPADGQSAPAPEGGDTAAPAPEPEAPAAPADATEAPAPEGAAQEPAPEAPAAEAAPDAAGAASSTIEASQLKIGQAVLGSDGAKIGEINGVKSDTSGKVQEILVTAGTPAGMNAQVYAIGGDKITEVSDGVKLSISSEEAKQLPIVDKSNG
ncbi:hypothetical protein Hden_1806 [Hyphomicrobium denitrificans ATCC 51888]|uniref:PRC-barrel domain-containing protein n=2 Tax=Hyphomicrobium denitrificans TaxID=53399 RepID=D8JZ07_HYPDA|nr:hypothetical protein Hden_1806 [Hyphomicrobium denitrificans ATCC 51888]